MIPARFSLSLLFFCILSISVFAQQTINGQITDAETDLPIRHAEVFVSGTTVGCITDSQGKFSLQPPMRPFVLIADHVAYESAVVPITGEENVNLKLNPATITIGEINVSARNKRKKNLRFFYSHFIEEDRNKIEILNDSVLIFNRDEMKFVAKTNEPLIVLNHILGYKIKIILEEFSVIAFDGPNGKQLPLNSMNGREVTEFTGYYYFEPLENYSSEKAENYRVNRHDAYYGSCRHFLKSIYDNDLEMQGFKIETLSPESETAFYEIGEYDDHTKEYVISADSLKVCYRFDKKGFPVPEEELSSGKVYSQKISVIHSTNESFLIRENGTSPRLPFIIEGLMTIKSIVNSLPEDYTPPER
ncbi:carboxypeptidase-like regulatory domain-containing protein [uncultured Draconibacterium sp.]|uniref:carboxypeptidase-like regulatory domain-containing protein n=1 Tax=uncultured Draconibacterium sp. TaxID=1573823 RepID=UPI0025EE9BEC|nr:carboxypeptidase-like regulatory domain-containing protein [uncultured Draconibacterium sp.]